MKKQFIIIIFLLLLTSCKTKTYTVTFVDNNQELAKIEIQKGNNISNIDLPTKDGYLFLNWLKDEEVYDTFSPISEDITLEASWIPIPTVTKTYTVTFEFSPSVIKTMSIKEGEKVPVPSLTPQKDKYKFIGWYQDDELYDFDTPVNSDISLYAKFEKSRIIINYDLDGGSGTIETEININTIPQKPKNPKKFGYTFTNWTIDDDVYNFDTPLSKDTTIKANYEANIYVSIMFDTDGGNLIPSQILLSGDSIQNIPIPQKEGYTFLYWVYDDIEFDTNMKITKDITLKAIYEKNN